eukprot:c14370_g1_i1 orf=135-317(+)
MHGDCCVRKWLLSSFPARYSTWNSSPLIEYWDWSVGFALIMVLQLTCHRHLLQAVMKEVV